MGWIGVRIAFTIATAVEATIDITSAYSAGVHWVQTIPYYSPNLGVVSLQPNAGPVAGGTEVVLECTGVRDFGRLMKCRFGQSIVDARLQINIGEPSSAFNGHVLVCTSPPSANATSVAVEITLTGETFTDSGIQFTYYDPPLVDVISPLQGPTRGNIPITVTGSGFRGNYQHASGDVRYSRFCRFLNLVNATQPQQIPFDVRVPATLLNATSDSVLTCPLPPAHFVGRMTLSLSLNGQDFGPSFGTFDYRDYWHVPQTSGRAPAARVQHSATLIPTKPQRLLVFGGFNGQFRNDLHVLYLDVMDDMFPSATALDFTWADLSHPALSPGDRPPSRAQHTASWVGGQLFIIGGISDFYAPPLDTVYRLDTNSMVWTHVTPESSFLVSPRALHSATVVGSRILVFGGRSMEECGYGPSRPCYASKSDTFYLDTDSLAWIPAESSMGVDRGEVVRPAGRYGHSASGVDEKVWVIGGAAVTLAGDETLRNDIFVFDTSDGTWSEISVNNDPSGIPSPRMAHVTVVVNHGLVGVFGGYGNDGPLGDLWLLDTVRLVWTRKDYSGSPSARQTATASAISNTHVLLFGGMSVSGRMMNDLHMLTPLFDGADGIIETEYN